MATIDKHTREAIVAAVRAAAFEAMEVYQEEWLTGKQLAKEMPFFTLDWLKHYGHLLPRERVRVTEATGKIRETGWCYPKKKLLRMVSEGSLRRISTL